MDPSCCHEHHRICLMNISIQSRFETFILYVSGLSPVSICSFFIIRFFYSQDKCSPMGNNQSTPKNKSGWGAGLVLIGLLPLGETINTIPVPIPTSLCQPPVRVASAPGALTLRIPRPEYGTTKHSFESMQKICM